MKKILHHANYRQNLSFPGEEEIRSCRLVRLDTEPWEKKKQNKKQEIVVTELTAYIGHEYAVQSYSHAMILQRDWNLPTKPDYREFGNAL